MCASIFEWRKLVFQIIHCKLIHIGTGACDFQFSISACHWVGIRSYVHLMIVLNVCLNRMMMGHIHLVEVEVVIANKQRGSQFRIQPRTMRKAQMNAQHLRVPLLCRLFGLTALKKKLLPNLLNWIPCLDGAQWTRAICQMVISFNIYVMALFNNVCIAMSGPMPMVARHLGVFSAPSSTTLPTNPPPFETNVKH